MNKKILITAILVSVLGIGIFSSTKVLAQNILNGQNPMSSLVQKIADKFGLKKEDVQAVFDQDRAEHQVEMEAKRAERQAEMETKYKAQLDQDVKDGKITEAQKELILAKRKELEASRQAEMQNMQGKTAEERKAAMEAKKTEMEKKRKELEDWAKQNGIDLKYLMGGFGRHGGPDGPGGPRGEFTPPPKPTGQ